jgi:hypothetical protein
MEVFKISNRNT